VILSLNAIIIPIRLINVVTIVGILRGGGDAGFAFITEGLTMWLIGVPMAVIGAFVLKLDVQWVVLMVMAEELIKMICSLTRLKSGKWIKDVVLDT
jgi:Na+-driven multidrug efflux pump